MALKKLHKFGGIVGGASALALAGAQSVSAANFNIGNLLGNQSVNNTTNFRNSASNLANSVITIVLTIAAILAVLYLIYSGILYITAGGNAERTKQARSGIINAVIGIVIIAASFLIVRFALGLGKDLTNTDSRAITSYIGTSIS